MSTGESWNGIMHDLETESNGAATVFCVSFVLVVQFCMLNLFVAVILNNFHKELSTSADNFVDDDMINNYRHQWSFLSDQFREELELRLKGKTALTRSTKDSGIEQEIERLKAEEGKRGGLSDFPSFFAFDDHAASTVRYLANNLYDPVYLPAAYFRPLFVALQPPLGMRGSQDFTNADFLRVVSLLEIPITKTGMINYHATLSALIDHAIGDPHPAVQQALGAKLSRKAAKTVEKNSQEVATSHTLAEEMAALVMQRATRSFVNKLRLDKLLARSGKPKEEIHRLRHQFSKQNLKHDIVNKLFGAK